MGSSITAARLPSSRTALRCFLFFGLRVGASVRMGRDDKSDISSLMSRSQDDLREEERPERRIRCQRSRLAGGQQVAGQRLHFSPYSSYSIPYHPELKTMVSCSSVRTRASSRRRSVKSKAGESSIHAAAAGEEEESPDLSGDYHNICILVFLYVLQGIPLGLAGSIPLILQNRKASYSQQATFSFVNWPFSVKLLWAPIVDSLYHRRFGRRKSWLVPTQYLIALFMCVLSYFIEDLLAPETDDRPGQEEAVKPPTNAQIYLLTLVFLALDTLAATQDIAVDGWALTMLKRRNVAYASTCNTVGQTMGYFLGNVVFLALESSEFCHKALWFLYRDQESKEGLVTLSSFLYFWGVVFFVSTTLVMLFKRENRRSSHSANHQADHDEVEGNEMGIMQTYSMLYKIIRLKAVQLFVLILFTCKIGFAVADSVAGLKLIEFGVKKEHMAMLAVPMIPLQIILPWILSRYTAGPRPLDLFVIFYPYRLVFGLIIAATVWLTSIIKLADGTFPAYYYVVLLLVYATHQITVYAIYVSLMSFHAKTADPTIGGTYMTLLNTLTNLGSNWPATLALYTVEWLNVKTCTEDGVCVMRMDGFYIQSVAAVIIGFAWLLWAKHRVHRLQSLPASAWLVPK